MSHGILFKCIGEGGGGDYCASTTHSMCSRDKSSCLDAGTRSQIKGFKSFRTDTEYDVGSSPFLASRLTDLKRLSQIWQSTRGGRTFSIRCLSSGESIEVWSVPRRGLEKRWCISKAGRELDEIGVRVCVHTHTNISIRGWIGVQKHLCGSVLKLAFLRSPPDGRRSPFTSGVLQLQQVAHFIHGLQYLARHHKQCCHSDCKRSVKPSNARRTVKRRQKKKKKKQV